MRISDGSSDVCSSDLSAYAHALHAPYPIIAARNARPHRAHGSGGGEHVLAFEKPANLACPHGQRGEHQRAVADRLVARNAQTAPERPVVAEASGRWSVRQSLTLMKNVANARGLLTVPSPYGKARAILHPDLSDS